MSKISSYPLQTEYGVTFRHLSTFYVSYVTSGPVFCSARFIGIPLCFSGQKNLYYHLHQLYFHCSPIFSFPSNCKTNTYMLKFLIVKQSISLKGKICLHTYVTWFCLWQLFSYERVYYAKLRTHHLYTHTVLIFTNYSRNWSLVFIKVLCF